MAKKTTTKRKLDLKEVLAEVDARNYDFYDSLEDDQKKEFSPYVLMRFISSAKGDSDIQEWFLDRTNELVNKNFFVLGHKHKKLMWQLCAATGAGISTFHPYIGTTKAELNKIEKLIAELNPSMKIEDIKLLSSMMTEDDKKDLFDKMGFDKQQRKEYE